MTKKMGWLLVFIIGLVLGLGGCTKLSLGTEDYRRWVSNPRNGLVEESDFGFLKVSVQYMPDDYVALLDCKNNDQVAECMALRKSELSGLQYYTLRLSLKEGGEDLLKYGLSSPSEYSGRIQYCSSGMQEDVYLEQEDVRYPCKLFHFERTYGLTPYASFMLVFERPSGEAERVREGKTIGDKTLYYNDRLFNLGQIKLRLSGSSLSEVPELN